MTQRTMILSHLKSGKSLTALEALHKFQVMRCAARVLELREHGHRIKTELVRRKGKTWACYSI